MSAHMDVSVAAAFETRAIVADRDYIQEGVACFTITASAAAHPATAPPMQAVVLLDTSLSMLARDTFAEAKRAVATFASQLRDGVDHLALVTFDGTPRVAAGLNDGPLTPAHRAAFARALAAAECGMGTNLEEAFRAAVAMISASPDADRCLNLSFIVVTDGEPVGAEPVLTPAFERTLAEWATEMPAAFSVYTVGVGTTHDARLFARLAMVHDGLYLAAPTPSRIIQGLAAVHAHMSAAVAADLMIEFEAPADKSATVRTELSSFVQGRRLRLREPLEMLVHLDIAPMQARTERPLTLVVARVSYTDLYTQHAERRYQTTSLLQVDAVTAEDDVRACASVPALARAFARNVVVDCRRFAAALANHADATRRYLDETKVAFAFVALRNDAAIRQARERLRVFRFWHDTNASRTMYDDMPRVSGAYAEVMAATLGAHLPAGRALGTKTTLRTKDAQ